MELIDVSFSDKEKELLRHRIGTKLRSVKCDPFSFNNWVYQKIGILFEDTAMVLKNGLHAADYYGVDEDICWFELFETKESEIVSGLANVTQIDIPFNETLAEIILIQEEQKLYIQGTLSYHVMLTRGMIFLFSDGREIAFEKTDPFSEEIEIRRGTNLAGTFSIKNDPDEWDEDSEMIITQDIVSV